jgi:hypothetical protein
MSHGIKHRHSPFDVGIAFGTAVLLDLGALDSVDYFAVVNSGVSLPRRIRIGGHC